jgi:Tol biopolymer transport system component
MLPRKRLVIYILFVAALLGVGLIASRSIGMAAPHLPEDGAEAGVNGPIRLVFSEPMDAASVETRFQLDPPVKGRFEWADQRKMLLFWPDMPFQSGTNLTIHLEKGAESQANQKIRRSVRLPVKVRQPGMVFLSPVDHPEIWSVKEPGQPPTQITFSGGSVFDFNVSPDGNHLVYSALNSDNGLDLWEIQRNGSQPKLILPCQGDWCINPAYSPDGRRVAYSRRKAAGTPGEGPGVPVLWMLSLDTQKTLPVIDDPNIGGFDPIWSPDGKSLAFFDGLSGGVRVYDIDTSTHILLPSQMGMTGRWSPDSQSLLFTEIGDNPGEPFVDVYEADIETGAIRRIFENATTPMDYSLPEWSPDGKQLAAAVRQANSGPGKQIVLLDRDGTQIQAVTQDQLYTHNSYHWSPGSDSIVYQRLRLDSSDNKPEIMLWNNLENTSSLVAQDAFLPRWLP